MSTSVYTGLNPFSFIRKHFLQIWIQWNATQQPTSTATSILTTKSTYRSLSAQRLSEHTVFSIYFVSRPKNECDITETSFLKLLALYVEAFAMLQNCSSSPE